VPRRSLLSDSDKQSLLGIPTDLADLSKYYLLFEADISLIGQKRGKHNKLGFALLLCCMRYLGLSFDAETDIPLLTLKFIANQLKIKDFSVWRNYLKRDSTCRDV
jgi:TnpA family transposase